MSAFVLPMVGTMTIITSFLSLYIVKFGWKIGNRFEQQPSEQKNEEEQEEPRRDMISTNPLEIVC
jgi:monovalent cation:H+ antiporter-2, CPA2 family